ncbi:hypothetical protein MNV49_000723 [Pseudohyphozyma bogoriensis]|nr:hypothetical protein MNV49_000723 [Pseudohyphozyma bogoriensis]
MNRLKSTFLSRQLALQPWLCRHSATRYTSSSSSAAASAPPYRILLLGSDNFSCATLRAVHAAREGLVEKLVVVVPPEVKVGRNLKKVFERPLQKLAKELDLEVITLPPTGLKDWEPPSDFSTLSSSNILLTASFGYLIPSSLLSRFHPLSTLNVHPSLLPKYRGAAPIQWALINGDQETGRDFVIPGGSDFTSLEPLLGKVGADLLVDILKDLPAAQASATPQDPSTATLAPKLNKEMSRVTWSTHSATQLVRLQRGISHQYPLRTAFVSQTSPESFIQLQFGSKPAPSTSAVAQKLLRSHKHGEFNLDTETKQLMALKSDPNSRGGSYRDERDDYYRGGPDFNGGGPRGPRMDSPESLPYVVTRRYFDDWTAQTQPNINFNVPEDRELVDSQWRKYLAGSLRKEFTKFFDEMKDKPWFEEKYGVGLEVEEMRKRIKEKGREGRSDKFLDDLAEGKLDNVSFDFKPKAKDVQTTDSSEDVRSEDVKIEESDVGDEDAALSGTLVPVKLSTSSHQLFIKTIGPEISRGELETHCSKVLGFDYLVLSDPNPLKKFHRVGWVVFKEGTDMDEASKLLCESTIGTFTLHMILNVNPIFMRTRATPGLLATPERIVKDLESIRRAAASFEKETGDTRGSEAIEERHSRVIDETDDVAAENKKTLDLYLHYLRFAFHTCFYCVTTCEFAEQLERKCPKHIRREVGAKTSAINQVNQQGWVTKFDEKLPLLTDKETVDPVEFGGDSVEEELHRVCHPHIKQEEEGKFRCDECKKLFSALKFVEKHIVTKHPEFIGTKLDRTKFYNNYILDPAHLPFGANEPPRPIPENEGPPLGDRIGGRMDDSRAIKRRRDDGPRGPPPPPPPGAVMDPRARGGRLAYADLDGAPAGSADVVLPY